jgi:uncharacterized membrane protein YphA (DoxX/SURF4 family)
VRYRLIERRIAVWQLILRIGIGLLLMIHGFAHWQITTAWGTKTSVSSWMLPSLEPGALQSLGTFLWVAALVTFVATGIVLFIGLEWWRVAAVVSCLISLLVIGLFWQPNMVIGVAVDLGVLVSLLWVQWPSPQWLEA